MVKRKHSTRMSIGDRQAFSAATARPEPLSFNIALSTPDARALLALLKSSNTFPDVVEALAEKLDIIDGRR